jgi:hypothetical protein
LVDGINPINGILIKWSYKFNERQPIAPKLVLFNLSLAIVLQETVVAEELINVP